MDGPPSVLREGGTIEQNFHRLTGGDARGVRTGGRS
jgi:hypothetical protein